MTAVLLILPQGPTVTGVTTWAVRLAERWARDGRPAGLLVHGSAEGHAPIDLPSTPGLGVCTRPDLPDVTSLSGDVSALTAAYTEAAERLADRAGGGPVCLVPTRHGDCFAACIAVCDARPELARLVGWQHGDLAYERAVLRWAAPACAALAGVSRSIAAQLAERSGRPGVEVAAIPNGVQTPEHPPAREPTPGRPVRAIYTGRLEHEHKRVNTLVAMGDRLASEGVGFELELIGDGPAAAELRDAECRRPWLRLAGALAPQEVGARLARADVFVLGSRVEGLSLSLLEAMAAGCCPVLTDTRSGAREVVDDARTGILVPFGPEEDDAAVGRRLAEGLCRARAIGIDALGRAAHACVRDRFRLDTQAERAWSLLERAARTPPRPWTGQRPIAFSAPPGAGASGTVPPFAAERMRAALGRLGARRAAVFGIGEHTRRLVGVLEGCPQVVAFSDDAVRPDAPPATLWGRPLLAPGALAGVAEVVVLSSWLHEPELWAGRGRWEREGIGVRRLYDDDECP